MQRKNLKKSLMTIINPSYFFTIQKALKIIPITLLPLLIIGCAYRPIGQVQRNIFVDYIQGDTNGLLTNKIINTIHASCAMSYSVDNPSIILKGEIIKAGNHTIGYQYDRDPTSERLIHRLVASEGRNELKVKITLKNAKTSEIICKPIYVSANADYDFYDSDSLFDTSFIKKGERESTLFFSLGQLDSRSGAQKSSCDPLYEALSVKVVEGILTLLYSDKNE